MWFDLVIFFIFNLYVDEMVCVKFDVVFVNWVWWKKNCRYGKKNIKVYVEYILDFIFVILLSLIFGDW